MQNSMKGAFSSVFKIHFSQKKHLSNKFKLIILQFKQHTPEKYGEIEYYHYHHNTECFSGKQIIVSTYDWPESKEEVKVAGALSETCLHAS